MFTHFITAQFSDSVKAQVVFGRLYLVDQRLLQRFELSAIDLAFEDRFLHPLPSAFANSGDTPQATASFTGFSIYVVADNDQH